jgi:hypothetical protein
MNKREAERAIFELVYDPDRYESVVHRDKPDFEVLTRFGGRFGVEATELFPSEADARLRKRPDYITELLAGDPHMHRDDISVLQSITVEITDPDGSVKQTDVPAVLLALPTIADHAQGIADTITRKNTKATDYKADGYSFTSLVIFDWFPPESNPLTEYSLRELLTFETRKALNESSFREVYLAGMSEEGLLSYRPLRLILALEAMFMFGSALEQFRDGDIFQTVAPAGFISLFIQVSSQLGRTYSYALVSGEPFAVGEAAAVTASPGSETRVLDLFDGDPPASCALPAAPLEGTDLVELADFVSAFENQNAFISGVAVAARLRTLADFAGSVGYVLGEPLTQVLSVREIPPDVVAPDAD